MIRIAVLDPGRMGVTRVTDRAVSQPDTFAKGDHRPFGAGISACLKAVAETGPVPSVGPEAGRMVKEMI